jgi:hypothetical protein
MRVIPTVIKGCFRTNTAGGTQIDGKSPDVQLVKCHNQTHSKYRWMAGIVLSKADLLDDKWARRSYVWVFAKTLRQRKTTEGNERHKERGPVKLCSSLCLEPAQCLIVREGGAYHGYWPD